MNVNNCKGCFADGHQECKILTKRITKDCPFKKSYAKYYRDQYDAGKRLLKLQLQGKFDPYALENLKEQALTAMEMAK